MIVNRQILPFIITIITILLLSCNVKMDEKVFPKDDWLTATPQSQGVDSIRLENAMKYLKSICKEQGTSQALVIRHGYLIWQGDSIDNTHQVWSNTKSFTSTILGLLIDDGKCTIDTKVKTILPELAEHYPDLTFRQISSLTSGYRANDGKFPFTPIEPKFESGKYFDYNDHSMNEFSNILTHLAGESMKSFFKRRIADPIGMDSTKWNWGSFGKIDGLEINGGSGTLGKAVRISAREIARFGWLLVNRGEWDGRRLISSKWVETATSTQTDTVNVKPYNDGRLNKSLVGAYGFNFWTNGYRIGGELRWPDAPLNTAAIQGYNNNYCIIIPDWDMVVVRLGTDGKRDNDLYRGFFSLLKKAVH